MSSTIRDRDVAVPLSGEWQFATDPEGSGETDAWHDPDATWADARVVSVPHAWQEQEDLREYAGVAWYRRTFSFGGLSGGERALLSFGAVDYETDAWVNGRHVGANEGGYLPFALDATDAVEAGENTVVLRVSDPADLSEVPHGKQGDPWYTRVSGPWQPIDLVTVPETHVEAVRVTPDLDADAATVECSVAGPVEGLSARVALAREGDVAAETTVDVRDGEDGGDGGEGRGGGTGEATATLALDDPDYWTPERPALYDYAVELLDGGTPVDRCEGYFGMRSVAVEDGELRLNGEPFAVRGALDQAYYPDTFYRPADLETFEREVRTARELGFNLLRKHIKPPHPRFVELADRLGLLVWAEPANPDRYTEASKRRVREQLGGMIERDYNSPSVVVWSLYNEEWGIGAADDEVPLWTDDDKQEYLASLYRRAREWDPTRLVCDNSGWAHVATDLNDYHEYFVAPDRVDAWRERLDEVVANPGANYGATRTDPGDAPLLVSEFGTWGLPDVSRLLDHYGGEPHWFAHGFLEGMKRPAGVRERFAGSHAATVFDSLSDLAAAWQRREFQSVETIVADMRAHEGVDGYVITEFTDVEWEFNGVLDYLRAEKAFRDGFARVNAPVMVHLEPDGHVAWSGETVTADLVVVNDGADPVETTVTCECPAADYWVAVDVSVGAHESRRLPEVVSLVAPEVDGLTDCEVSAAMDDPDWRAARSIYVAPRERPDGTPVVSVEGDRLRTALADRGYETVADPADADVSVVADPADADGATLVVPDEDGDLAESEQFEYRPLPRRASWNLCACLLYQDLLPGVDPVPGWAFEDLYPYGYVAEVDPGDDVSVGYVEGWLENEGAVVLTRVGEDGPTGVCTLRVTDAYGDHPVATAVCDRLLRQLSS